MSEVSTGEVTQLLESWGEGDPEALEKMIPIVYKELRQLAGYYLRGEREGHTLQPTALINELLLRLMSKTSPKVKDSSHFYTLAAQAMRRILVDHARRHRAGKRIGAGDKIPLDSAPESFIEPDIDVVALHEALETLAEINPRQEKIVNLRYFGGLTNREVAEVLKVSLGTVENDWKVARVWLHRRLTRG